MYVGAEILQVLKWSVLSGIMSGIRAYTVYRQPTGELRPPHQNDDDVASREGRHRRLLHQGKKSAHRLSTSTVSLNHILSWGNT